MSFDMTDGTGSMRVSRFCREDAEKEAAEKLHVDQWVTVSRTTSPVTHTADVAVNRQSEKPVAVCCLDAAGSISKSVPIRIINANPSAMIWKVVIRTLPQILTCFFPSVTMFIVADRP